MMTDSSYGDAQGAFLDEARALGAELVACVHRGTSPQGEPLAVDFAILHRGGKRR